jgi:hypothetical protein
MPGFLFYDHSQNQTTNNNKGWWNSCKGEKAEGNYRC